MLVELSINSKQKFVNINVPLETKMIGPVARHFYKMGHDVNSLRFMGLEIVSQTPRGGGGGVIMITACSKEA